ncbi:hypothetical protein [Phaeobacter sp. HF9A]|uniref:hypothetical protein n=1 Tax=Phaeobacter sp. HF9A TaxID=2721561 RepID=UPI00142F88E0|nr:hypothetical protein [Phaeobacter sp. HF9A]NIZ12088.1 hypothetical protein [Phaeobacter sp. HF9A]
MSAPDRIEDQLNVDRRRFADSLLRLSNSLAPDAVSDNLTAAAHGHGDGMTRQALRFAGRNPAGMVLTGLGVAMMVSGLGARRKTAEASPARSATSAEATSVGIEARVAAADAAIKPEKIEVHATEATEAAGRSRGFYAQNPLAVGAITLGLGALIGTMLPATRRKEMENASPQADKTQRDVGADTASASGHS